VNIQAPGSLRSSADSSSKTHFRAINAARHTEPGARQVSGFCQRAGTRGAERLQELLQRADARGAHRPLEGRFEDVGDFRNCLESRLEGMSKFRGSLEGRLEGLSDYKSSLRERMFGELNGFKRSLEHRFDELRGSLDESLDSMRAKPLPSLGERAIYLEIARRHRVQIKRRTRPCYIAQQSFTFICLTCRMMGSLLTASLWRQRWRSFRTLIHSTSLHRLSTCRCCCTIVLISLSYRSSRMHRSLKVP